MRGRITKQSHLRVAAGVVSEKHLIARSLQRHRPVGIDGRTRTEIVAIDLATRTAHRRH